MADYIHLIGADEVARAGSSMRSAADDMCRASSSIDESLTRFRFFMDDWLDRLEHVLKNNTKEEI